MPQRTSVTEKAKAAQRAAFCYFGEVSANMAAMVTSRLRDVTAFEVEGM